MDMSLFEPEMPANELRLRMASGAPVAPDSETAAGLREYGKRARWITTYLNCVPHEPHIIRRILEELTLYPVHGTVTVYPPFYCAIGINLHFGHNLHIAQSCHLQDQNVIRIDDDCIIDDNVVIMTAARDPRVAGRDELRPSPVHIEHDVWIGANSTIMPGVTIGAKAVILPGSVVMKDVRPGTIAGGVPAQYLRDL